MGAVHEILRRVHSEARPCLRLAAARARSSSHLGGLPQLPVDAEWPAWKGTPMAFLAQINLSDAPPFDWPDFAPREGRFLFFYEASEAPWGFDPGDRGCCAVIYVAPDIVCAEREIPAGVPAESRFRRKDVTLATVFSYPSYERVGGYEAKLSGDELDEVSQEFEALGADQDSGSGQLHQIFGWPSPVQGDAMELEAQLASNGIYCGDAAGYKSPGAERLKDGAPDWQLLFQLDSDDDTGMMWGDAGVLYFWIRRADAARRDFSNVWLVLQCC